MEERYALVDERGIIAESSDREEIEQEFENTFDHQGDLLMVEIIERKR